MLAELIGKILTNFSLFHFSDVQQCVDPFLGRRNIYGNLQSHNTDGGGFNAQWNVLNIRQFNRTE